MENNLKEKLWYYIVHNNPDLMFKLQEEYTVSDYLNEKVNSVQSLIDKMRTDSRPQYIIEEMCLNELTEDLKPSRFLYIQSLLEEEFEQRFSSFSESGILTYEILNLMESCSEVFETIGFTKENEEDPLLRNAIIGQISDYLN